MKFELNNSANVAMTFYSESVEYDSSLDTFSQRFQLKKKPGDELQLCVVACVHIDGQISKKGAFQSIIVTHPSGEEVSNRCMVHFIDGCNKAERATIGRSSRVSLFDKQAETIGGS